MLQVCFLRTGSSSTEVTVSRVSSTALEVASRAEASCHAGGRSVTAYVMSTPDRGSHDDTVP